MNKDMEQLQLLSNKFNEKYLTQDIDHKEAQRLTQIVFYSVYTNLLGLNVKVSENLQRDCILRLIEAESMEKCSSTIYMEETL